MTKRELIVLLFIAERVEIPEQLSFFVQRLHRMGLVRMYGSHYRCSKRGEQMVDEIMYQCEDSSLALALAASLRERRVCQKRNNNGGPSGTEDGRTLSKKQCQSSRKLPTPHK